MALAPLSSLRASKFVGATLALALAFTGLTALAAPAPAAVAAEGAGLPFDCSDPRFFAVTSGGTAQLYTGRSVTPPANAWTPLGAGSSTNYNALAYNPTDGFMYGINPGGTLYRIDSAGVPTALGASGLGAAGSTLWDSGTIVGDTYYVASRNAGNGTIRVINNVSQPTRSVGTAITVTAGLRFADLAFKDGFLWAMSYSTAAPSPIYRIALDGTVTNVTRPADLPAATAYGSAFTMNNGNLAFISPNTMYQVHITDPTGAAPTAELVGAPIAAPANSQSDATTCIAAPVDLSVAKSGPASVVTGANITYSIVVTNTSTANSSGYTITDVLPTGLGTPTITSANGTATYTAGTRTITVAGNAIAAGATHTITVVAPVTAAAGSTLSNSVSVIGNEADNGAAANNGSTATTNVVSAIIPADAVDDVATTVANTAVTIDLVDVILNNDTGTGISVTAVQALGAAGGAITRNSDGDFIYTPVTGFSGTDAFTYTLSGSSGTDTATVRVTVSPVAVRNTAATQAGVPVTIDLKSTARGTGVSVTNLGTASHGSLVLNGSGHVVYTPTNNTYVGTDTFTYRVTDASGNVSAPVTVTVTISAVAPDAVNDAVSTTANTSVRIDLEDDILVNDTGTSVSVAAGNVTSTRGVIVTRNGAGDFIYTPTANSSGVDTFTYTLTGPGGTDTATVTVTVRPVAVLDSASTTVGAPVTLDVVSAASGTTLAPTNVTNGAHGSAAVVGGNIVYTPSNNTYSGTDTFTYTVTGRDNVVSAPITVTVQIRPVAVLDEATTRAGVAVTIDVAADALGSGVVPTNVSVGANGTTAVVDGKIVYTPTNPNFSGTDTFTYRVTDENGLTSAPITVTVTIIPIAVVDEASTESGEPVTIDVVTPAQGTGLEVTGLTNGTNGTTLIDADGNIVYTPTFEDFSGTDTFTYTLTDDQGNVSAPITVTVTVLATAPIAGDDEASTVTNLPVTISLTGVILLNDSGTNVSVTAVDEDSAMGGSIERNLAGDFVYVPASGFSGYDFFSYILSGPDGFDTAVVTVAVRPVATVDEASTTAGNPVAIDVVAGAAGIDLTPTSVSNGANGSTSIVDNTIVYSPNGDFSGTDTFTYRVQDSSGLSSAPITVTVTVIPIAVLDEATTTANTPVTIDVVTPGLGTGLEVTDLTDGANGSTSINGDGNVVYTPTDAEFSGTDTFTYTVTDNDGNVSAPITVTVTVIPVAVLDEATTESGDPVTIDVVTPALGTGLAVTDLTDGTNGTTSVDPDGNIVYTPSNDTFVGTDTFTYTVTDDEGNVSAPITVTVTVAAKTTVAGDDTASTTTNTTITIDLADVILDNDSGTAIAVTSFDAQSTEGGDVSRNGSGDFVYEPADGFSGIDTFTYTISGPGGTDTATVTVTVRPVAVVDSATTRAGVDVVIDVITDALGQGLAATAVTDGAHGETSVNSDGDIVYSPNNANFSGTDTFTYTVTGTNSIASAVKTVTVTINPVATVNEATTTANTPVAIDVVTDARGTNVEATNVSNGANGTTSVNADGEIVYTPTVATFSGTDTFTYRVTDEDGNVSAPITVTVTVNPVAVVNTATTPSGDPVEIDVITDALGTNVTPTNVTDGTRGTTSVNTDGEIVYTPNNNTFVGTDTFTYTVTDEDGNVSAPITVTVTITAKATVAGNDTAATTTNTAITIDLADVILDNDSGTAIAVTAVDASSAQGGEITRNGDGDFVYEPADGFSGIDTFEYTISGPGGTDTATVAVTVRPVAIIDAATTRAGVAVAIDVITDALGTDLLPASVTDGAEGTTAIDGDTIVYTPTDPDFSGTDTFTYRVVGNDGISSVVKTVTVTINPVAVTNEATTTANTPVAIDVVTDARGTNVEATNVSNGANGATSVNADGEIVYTPTVATFSGTDTFTYRVTDEDGNVSAPITVTVTVNPVAVVDEATTESGDAVEIDVITDALGTNVTPTNVTDGDHGSTTVNADGEIVYTPTNDTFVGTDTFTYTVTDEDGNISAPITVTVTITAKATVAGNDVAQTTANTPVRIDLDDVILDNDSGTAIAVTAVDASSAQGGEITRNADGDFIYTPADGFSGTDTFEYTISGPGGADTATVTVTVIPVAIVEEATTPSGDPVTIDLVTDALGTDVTVTNLTDGTRGTTELDIDGNVVYTPNNNTFVGTDTFTYTVTDEDGNVSAPVTVTVTITAKPTVAVGDTASTRANVDVTIDLIDVILVNDSGTAIAVTAFQGTSPHGATITRNGAGDFIYSPDTDYSGIDTFTYTISGPGGTDTATVTVRVRPVAVTNSATTRAGVDVAIAVIPAAQGTDVSATDVSNGIRGTTSVNGAGAIVYSPTNPNYSGTDTFIYTVTDADDLVSAPVTVTVTINPVAITNTASTTAGAPVSINVITDARGTNVTPTSVANGSRGTTSVVSGRIVYTPTNPNYSGTDTFTYRVTDASGNVSAPITLTVTIIPIAVTDEATTTAGTPVSIDVISDAHGTGLTATNVGDGTNGTTEVVDGEIVYTPTDPDFSGEDTFTYTVTDASGNVSAPVTVTVTVVPVAVVSSASTLVGTPVAIDVITDAQGVGLTATNLSNGTHGLTSRNAEGEIVYTPIEMNFSGVDTFTYRVTDANGSISAYTTVTVTIIPFAVIDEAHTDAGMPVTIDVLTAARGTELATTSVGNGTRGTTAVNAAGAIVYTPTNPNFSGTDEFTYTVTDSIGTPSAPVTVTVTIRPVAVDDNYRTRVDLPITIPASEIIANDRGTSLVFGDRGPAPLVKAAITASTNGSVALNGVGNPVFTPAPGFSGLGSFTYGVTDAIGQEASAVVYIVIVPNAPDDLEVTVVDAPVTIDVLANDAGSDLTITGFTQPAAGTVTRDGEQLVFTPAAGWSGIATFTYTSTDGSGFEVTANVTVTVFPKADANVEVTSTGQAITFDVLDNDAGTDLVVTFPTSPNGTFVVHEDGTVTFTPNPGYSGISTVIYTITDADGLTATADVQITVNPTAADDAIVVEHNTATVITPLANDNGMTLAITGTTPPSHGTIVVNADGTITYTPSTGYAGGDSFTYTVTDADGLAATATVTIMVGASGLVVTGVDPSTGVLAALMLLLLGGGFIFFGKRRRTEDA